MLMIDDEFDRLKSTQFHLLHPRPDTACHYNALYRHDRFSDHLLARWVIEGGSESPNIRKIIPSKYLKEPINKEIEVSIPKSPRAQTGSVSSPRGQPSVGSNEVPADGNLTSRLRTESDPSTAGDEVWESMVSRVRISGNGWKSKDRAGLPITQRSPAAVAAGKELALATQDSANATHEFFYGYGMNGFSVSKASTSAAASRASSR